jgi:iron complex transport system ATP-binding protein
MTAPAVEIRRLTVHGGGRRLVDVEHAQVDRGNVVGLMGPNGAGKTTLLRACLGLVLPTGGDIVVLGESVPLLRPSALARLRRRIGFVPQLPSGRGEMPLTVREVVVIGRTAHRGLFHRLSSDDWNIADQWIDRLGLSPLADRAFGQISGGEQRKTIIARAMAQEPELLLFDEPTANLDLGWRERLVALIQSLHEQTGISMVLVCHELEVLPPCCRQVVLLEAGRVSAAGPPEAVFSTELVRRLYGANLRTVHQDGRHATLPGSPHD